MFRSLCISVFHYDWLPGLFILHGCHQTYGLLKILSKPLADNRGVVKFFHQSSLWLITVG